MRFKSDVRIGALREKMIIKKNIYQFKLISFYRNEFIFAGKNIVRA